MSAPPSHAPTANEDRSVKSQYVLVNSKVVAAAGGQTGSSPAAPQQVSSRMETYRADWAEQECSPSKPSRPLLPEDIERWREEKARRMLAWINNSQLTGYWGSDIPWWKVSLLYVHEFVT